MFNFINKCNGFWKHCLTIKIFKFIDDTNIFIRVYDVYKKYTVNVFQRVKKFLVGFHKSIIIYQQKFY